MDTDRRTYAAMLQHHSFEDRFDYLVLGGRVGDQTFGYERHMNQSFYRSTEWKQIRSAVIVRDNGCDLGHPDHIIVAAPHIHHMNPITPEQLENGDFNLFDIDGLITVSQRTHNAIHYGSRLSLPSPMVERRPGDTDWW